MTEPNQAFSKNLSATPFFDTNTLSQTFGIEPNYPCCTVNHPQGYPKFTMYSYLRKGKKGIVHALLSPGRVETQVQGKPVSVDCQTDYPFNGTLSYAVKCEDSFELYLRVPKWATSTTVQVGDSQIHTPPVDPHSGLIELKVPSGTTKIRYDLEMELQTVSRANDTVAIYRGPLLYAFHIPHTVSSGPPKFYTNQTDYPAGTYPPQAQDHTLLNTTEWNIAIDPTTLEFHQGAGPLPSPTFEDGKLPAYVTVRACLIEWPMFVGAVPGTPIPKKERKCLGDTFEAILRPYGSAKLHMSDLPTIDLSG